MLVPNSLENRVFAHLSQNLETEVRGRFRYSELLTALHLNLGELVDALDDLEDKQLINLAVFPTRDWFVVEVND